jgi:hypothetical protein
LPLRVKPAKDKTQFRPSRQKTTRPRFFLSFQWRATKMPCHGTHCASRNSRRLSFTTFPNARTRG